MQTTVDYAPASFTVTQSTLGISPSTGPVSTSVSLTPSACPAPAGAVAWTSLVRFAQGSNAELSFANYPIAADGSWSGTFTIPTVSITSTSTFYSYLSLPIPAGTPVGRYTVTITGLGSNGLTHSVNATITIS